MSSTTIPSPVLPPASPPAASPDAGSNLGSGWRRALAGSSLLVTLSILVLAALWGAVAWQTHREQTEAVHNAEVELTNLTRAFAEHSAKTLESADQAIRFVRNEYLEHGKDLDIAGYLQDKRIIDSDFHLISVIGTDGYISHSSQLFQRVDLRDREHFKVHTTGAAGDALFISKPVLGRVSGKWSIQLTRRVDTPQGQFAGVVVLSLAPEYLTRFYSGVDLGAQGAITLVGYDGVVRARATHDDKRASQDLSQAPLFRQAMQRKIGTWRAVSSIDGVERLWAFRGLDAYGLLVVTGKGVDDIMAEARQRRSGYFAVASVLSVVIVGFAAGLVRRARAQQALLDELALSNERANAANVMKTRFLASVSHELRTPLNGILGYAELVRDGAGDEETRDHARAIHQSASRLHGMVNDILDLARIESGRMQVQLGDVDLRRLLAGVWRRHDGPARARALSLRLHFDPSCPHGIRTDAAKLEKVLHHLVDNAIRFSSEGDIDVTASARDGHLVVLIQDRGCGIAGHRIPALLTRFHSTTAEVTHAQQGAGLGLPLSHELMRMLGGSIRIDSRPGCGTTVEIQLPLDAAPAGPPPSEDARPCAHPRTP
ncbi:cache domain-containing sensor histidine kinase [Ideonella sp. YS5]|uniref:sensor histidine kinase n=1 Tax=Ideonella sp. YS5 TaxID=3453714 RepID=UPI003EED19CE